MQFGNIFLLLTVFVTFLHSIFAATRTYDSQVQRSTVNKKVALTNLKTEAIIDNFYAELIYTYNFRNTDDFNLEAAFRLPNIEGSYYVSLSATLKDETINAYIVDPKVATSSLRSYQASDATFKPTIHPLNTHSIYVGIISPQETVKIEFSIITPLEQIQDNQWNLVIPSSLGEAFLFNNQTEALDNSKDFLALNTLFENWEVSVSLAKDKFFEFYNTTSDFVKPNQIDSKAAKWIFDRNTVDTVSSFKVPLLTKNYDGWNAILVEEHQTEEDYAFFINIPVGRQPPTHNLADGTVKVNNLECKPLQGDLSPQNTKKEFIFVIDRSEAIDNSNLELLKLALSKLLKTFQLDHFSTLLALLAALSSTKLKAFNTMKTLNRRL